MKKFGLFLLIMLFVNEMQAQVIQKNIHEGWRFKQARLGNWYPATVPGVVHTDLMDNEIIEDPFYRLNERSVQWVDKEDWVYETRLEVTDEILGKSNIVLDFKGLDTYADVYLNDSLVLKADNMFREWVVDVKPIIQKNNMLRVYFHSPVKIDMPKWEALPFQYRAVNDQSENGGLLDRKISIFARKAGYHYGWDWGPRLVTSGIWRPVYLQAWNEARIENVFYQQEKVNDKSAKVNAQVSVVADKAIPDAHLDVRMGLGGQAVVSVVTDLQPGQNLVSLPFTVEKPRLWWCNGMGEPYLYDFTVTLNLAGEQLDTKTDKVGLRSMKIISRPDTDGQCFYVELNGVPVFCKGANYIPCDNFLPRVSHATYERTILDAVNVNMNMLRVWGGGIYENDEFYDLCDRYGIMVWQDFMFACSLYPAEGEFLENIRQEAVDNVRRLRNHACIALWCGNNECNDAWFNWGWKRDYEAGNQEYADKIYKQFSNQYFCVLPSVVGSEAPGAYYHPSSPFAKAGEGSNGTCNDLHNWSVWHGKQPIAEYNNIRSRFFSEYGFQAFPEFESVKLYAPQERDWNITSEVMMAHQRGGGYANELINTYLLNEYREPGSFEEFLYVNQVLQADAVKIAIEAHRRDRPYCMGSLYWQHNDCWPVASWSSRDYYGRWKALHYFAAKAFADILVSPIEKEGNLEICMVSDRLEAAKGELTVEVADFDGKTLFSYSRRYTCPANASDKACSFPLSQIVKDAERGKVYVRAVFKSGNKEYANNYFLTQQKNVDYPQADISYTYEKQANGYKLTLQSDKFARAVFLSLDGIDNFFSDNYFDILPNKKVQVDVMTDLSEIDFENQLKIKNLYKNEK